MALTKGMRDCRKCEHWVLDLDLNHEVCQAGNMPRFFLDPEGPGFIPRRRCGLFTPSKINAE